MKIRQVRGFSLEEFPVGLYDLLSTSQLHEKLQNAEVLNRAIWGELDSTELKQRLALPLAKEISKYLADTVSESKD
jgi:hypothetical protein